jgi:hypothetical protein
MYEYGIQHRLDKPQETHREGMTREQAVDWVLEFVNDGGSSEAFHVIRRPVGQWERDNGL